MFDFDEEKVLFDEINRVKILVEPLLAEQKYEESLRVLAELKPPVDTFFDQVMVMDEDPVKRANRLALLSHLKAQFDLIADLSILG